MKIKISELKPNPFKKQIAKGKLDEDQVKRIMSNMKELGLMGALPVFKKGNNYHLINGHHRIEALKREFGKDYQVEVVVHNYSEEQVLRGMVIENLTQRANDFKEEVENIVTIKNYLKKHVAVQPLNTQNPRPQNQPQPDSLRSVIAWLNKNGEVMSIGKISSLLNIRENLDEELFERVEKVSHATGDKEGETIGVKDAISLSKIEDKKEQKDMSKVLLDTREQHGNRKNKNMTLYKNAPEEVKKQIRSGSIDLADIELAITSYNLKETKKHTVTVEDISKKIDMTIDSLSFSISDAQKNLKDVIHVLARASKYIDDMTDGQRARMGKKISDFSKLLPRVSELLDKIEERI